MEVLTRREFKLRSKEILQKIRQGVIFIHPSDTIYGLGCDATNAKAISTIRQLKDRPATPLSIWVPSIDWIQKNCQINAQAETALAKLPGPYTLILKLKHKSSVPDRLTTGRDTIGIRSPDHWFSTYIQELGIPIVTTSANKHGKPFMTSLENLDPEIERGVEFMIYEGPKEGKPSKIIDVVEGKTIER